MGEESEPIECNLWEDFLLEFIGKNLVEADLTDLLSLIMNHANIGIYKKTATEPQRYKTCLRCINQLVKFILSGEIMTYI